MLAAVASVARAQSVAPGAKVDYIQDVKPILAAKCFSCHGPTQQQSGLRLDRRQQALRGGDYGPVIEPGKSAESKLILRVVGSQAGLQMPPTGALQDDEIAVLKAWIDQGADMPGIADTAIAEKRAVDPKVKAFLDVVHAYDTRGVARELSADKTLAVAVDASGSTSLMHAAYAGTVETMSALIDAGADVNAKNDRRATALHWAITDPAKVRLLLLKGADVNAKTVDGRTPLHLAAMLPTGDRIVEMLLEAGADVRARTLVGATPLHAAVSAKLESTRLLLAKGADPNAKTGLGLTPLMNAAFLGGSATVAALLDAGADAKVRTKQGETALADAADRGDLASVKLLLEHGAELNVVDHDGYTPLMHAAYCDNVTPDVIRVLLVHGADVNVSAEGQTALSIAAKRGETEVARILRDAQAAR
jgi:ankyrin repeat protein